MGDRKWIQYGAKPARERKDLPWRAASGQMWLWSAEAWREFSSHGSFNRPGYTRSFWKQIRSEGTDKKTTEKITSQHGMFCHRFLEKKGEEKARNYVQANQEAFRQYDKYHRCQGREGTVAIIPAVHLSSGNGSCSVQVITPKESLYREFPLSQFWINRTKGIMQIGDNLFSDLQPIWELQ